MEKDAARRAVRQAIRRMSAEERAERSARACRQALALPEMAAAETVMLFVTMPDEIDTLPLVEACLSAGKAVYAPRTSVRPRMMVPCRLCRTADLRPGAFGILEPPPDEVCSPEDLDMILVPALAYDLRGYRLGKGAGYYDRFMAHPGFRAVRVGFGFEVQVVEEVPTEAHDLPVDVVVTEERVVRVT